MKGPEHLLEREVLHELGRRQDIVLHTNEVGEGYYGALGPALRVLIAKQAPFLRQDVERLLGANRTRYGLAVGSSDLIAVVAPRGRFCAVELKSEDGRLSHEQAAWLARMQRLGAVAGVARSVADAYSLIEEARR